eukprot:316285-Chlamydomonas_euryale.AAC.4
MPTCRYMLLKHRAGARQAEASAFWLLKRRAGARQAKASAFRLHSPRVKCSVAGLGLLADWSCRIPGTQLFQPHVSWLLGRHAALVTMPCADGLGVCQGRDTPASAADMACHQTEACS